MEQNSIDDFRKNQIRQTALATLLQDDNLQTALAIIAQANRVPAIALDAAEIVSVRAAAQTRGSERTLDMLYLLATPLHEPVSVPESTYGANPNDLKQNEE